ncbi:MAG: ABC transporter permease, partial [Acidimicrobiales bacterium]|nr:ABC transporter permease [Acidimicrobiales bacterium]
MSSYVVADLVRNARRTLSSMVGVVLGVGLFCGVLFFVDGLSASMTQRAVEPLAIDMQRIVSQPAGAALVFTQTIAPADTDGEGFAVELELSNTGDTDAHEVTVRSVPEPLHTYLDGSATVDSVPVSGIDGNPFAQGPARAGLNLGTLAAGASVRLEYVVTADAGAVTDDAAVSSWYSSRESVEPVGANQPPPVDVDELARLLTSLPGVADAAPLSIADLGSDSLHTGPARVAGPAKVFGFDDTYAAHDDTIDIVNGSLGPDGAVVSAEAAGALELSIGDLISVDLPDGTTIELPVTGVADLSRSRALFSSRRGGDLETFIYAPNSVIVSPAVFAAEVLPAFERAAADNSAGRLKTPPILEVDITVERDVLDADPATAAHQTEQIAADVMSVAAHQDYLLDNITNTLHVAADDAAVAKRLFVFLGVPGALLAAMLAAYAGNVLAEAQRREQAILRIRGASRRHLLRMLALRTALLTGVGAALGLVAGYSVAVAVLGRASLERAQPASLATSAIVGTLAGFVATGAALYLTGRRSIDREINEDRSRPTTRQPLWRRARLDLAGLAIVAGGTAWALATDAFAG